MDVAYLRNQFTGQLFTVVNDRLVDTINSKWARQTPFGRWCNGGIGGSGD